MDNRSIGVFDSGLGGLTAVKELKKILPNENIVYLGDTGRIPYGTRSKETITKYAMQDISFLLKNDVKMIIAACGTVSATLPKSLTDTLPVPYTGVVLPLVYESCGKTKNNIVGAIGTTASIRSGAFAKAIHNINPNIRVVGMACPLFVHLVENGLIENGNEITNLTAKMYLEALKKENPDTLILGCTHFPLIYDAIQNIMGKNVNLIDPGKEVARYAQNFLTKNNMLGNHQKPTTNYYVTDTEENFHNIANIFLDGDIGGDVKQVQIDTL